jgi:hypothetical protein
MVRSSFSRAVKVPKRFSTAMRSTEAIVAIPVQEVA